MLDFELSKQAATSPDQQEEKQHPFNRPVPKPGGMVRDVPSESGMSGSAVAPSRNRDTTDILRFRESERMLHWAISIPFMICWMTALILFLVYNPAPSRPFRIVFATIHRFSGICLVILPLLSMFIKRGDLRIHSYNIRNAWLWSLQDLKWLLLMGIAAINKRIVLPEQGKFNAAEKVNFMLVMLGWPVFAATGTMMIFQDMPWIPWLIHGFAAFIVTPTMLGHIYMATVNPETRTGISGMISGYVDRQWAKHHYARWYREELIGSITRKPADVEVKKKSVGQTVELRKDPQVD